MDETLRAYQHIAAENAHRAGLTTLPPGTYAALRERIAQLEAALVDKQARLVYHSGHRPDADWDVSDDVAYFREVAQDYLREEGLLPPITS